MFNEIDHQVATFNNLRREFDPWYDYSDDHKVWRDNVKIERQLLQIRRDLGLFGQDLTIPVIDRRTATIIYR